MDTHRPARVVASRTASADNPPPLQLLQRWPTSERRGATAVAATPPPARGWQALLRRLGLD